jgi:hypothetical protein
MYGKRLQDQPLRLLLFQPGARVSTSSRAEMKEMVRDTLFLLLVMEEHKRIPVWPTVDCSSSWIAKSQHAKHGIDEVKVYAHGDGPHDRECFDIGYMNNGCSGLGVFTFFIVVNSMLVLI